MHFKLFRVCLFVYFLFVCLSVCAFVWLLICLSTSAKKKKAAVSPLAKYIPFSGTYSHKKHYCQNSTMKMLASNGEQFKDVKTRSFQMTGKSYLSCI